MQPCPLVLQTSTADFDVLPAFLEVSADYQHRSFLQKLPLVNPSPFSFAAVE